jgi:hypothetical protein
MMIGSKTAPIRDLILVQDRKYPSSRLTYTARPDYTYQNKTKNMGCCSRSGRGWRRFPARQVLDCMQAWILSSGSRALAVCQCWFDRRGVDADPVAGAAVVCRGRLASQSSTARRSYRIHLPSPDHGGPSPRARIADRCSGVTPISRAHSLLGINGLRGAAASSRATVASTTRSIKLSSCDACWAEFDGPTPCSLDMVSSLSVITERETTPAQTREGGIGSLRRGQTPPSGS